MMGSMEPPQLHETHISWIALIGDRAYKALKPVRTGFLDHRSRAAREAACHRELDHNRRFAPDVYLGVLDVLEADGTPRDHLLEMRRLPAGRRLSALLGSPEAEDRVREVAREVARLHRASPRSAAIDATGDRAHLADLWAEGWAQLRPLSRGLLEAEAVDEAAALAARYLDGRGPLLRARVADGWIRDGHGDLLADDVYCTADGPRVLDCLAFDDRLRRGDVLADIAFLAMDLESRGHPGPAAALIDEWSRALGESHPASLAHHYVAYRAHVRAKVAALRHAQGDPDAAARARALHALCLERLRRGRVRLVLVGGTPGTGKSTVAAAVGRANGWMVLRTDVLRRDVVGPPGAHGDPYGHGRYTAAARDRVYTRLLEAAAHELGMGGSVVLDASWSGGSHRRLARELAADLRADAVELCCLAPQELARRRIAARQPGDPSDADAAIAERMRADFDRWDGAVEVSTDRDLDRTVAAALAAAGPA